VTAPKYAQAAAIVRAQVADGMLKPGQAAPSGARLRLPRHRSTHPRDQHRRWALGRAAGSGPKGTSTRCPH
jgi:hypothetical protein